MLNRPTQRQGKRSDHLRLVQSMSPHHGAIQSEMDAWTTDTSVPLNIWHPELSLQAGYQHTLQIIPNSRSIRHPQLLHTLLDVVHARMHVISNSGLDNSGRRDPRMPV